MIYYIEKFKFIKNIEILRMYESTMENYKYFFQIKILMIYDIFGKFEGSVSEQRQLYEEKEFLSANISKYVFHKKKQINKN